MLQKFLAVFTFVVATLTLLPSPAVASEINGYMEFSLPASTITMPEAKATYTRSDKVFPDVSFASTSQIVAVDYVLNTTYVPYDKALPLFNQPLGTTTFSVVTEDIFGTISTSTSVFILTATPQSAIEDVREMYRLGTITKVIIRDRFLRSLESFADTYAKREKLLASADKRKEERAKLLSDRMGKILDSEILDLLKKQEGRTVKETGADMLRSNIETLRVYVDL